MEEKARFNVIYMDEAVKFLESLDEKVRGKIAYNIGKAMLVIDKELFKKMGDSDIWNLEPCMVECPIACLRFGTLMRKHWLLLLMAL